VGTLTRRRAASVSTTIGGIVAGVDHQIFRTTPPAQELVHHARPDDAVPTGDGRTIVIPPLELPASREEPGSDASHREPKPGR
jgi:hypothetical protein